MNLPFLKPRFQHGEGFRRLILGIGCWAATSAILSGAWDPLPSVDFSKISPAQFSDEELDLVGPLANFKTVAESVVEDGPDRGFIDIKVWRDPSANKTFNARVMENVLSLIWFYTADRSWNPYYGNPALRSRIEASLDFIARLQAPDGSFTEKNATDPVLPATAFMTKFLGEGLELLCAAGAPAIDPSVLERARATQRKAVEATLTRDDFYRSGRFFTNQYGNIWPGGQAWFHLHPDEPVLKAKWEERFKDSLRDFQSSAGYFYERNGPDFGYTLHTHASNSRGVWLYLKGTPYAEEFLAGEARWYEFLAYNVVPQPGKDWYVVNRAIESRQKFPVLYRSPSSLTDELPALIPFTITKEERVAQVAAERARLAREWPGAEPLDINHRKSFTPYIFYGRRSANVYPSQKEYATAVAKLPHQARDLFNHVRADARRRVEFFYLRRPAYYATFANGVIAASGVQRYGLGLLWRPGTGVLLQSQSHAPGLAWGTYLSQAKLPLEAQTFSATVRVNGTELPRPFKTGDLPAGDISFDYQVGKSGTKKVTFQDREITVQIDSPDSYREIIPLTIDQGQTLEISEHSVTLKGAHGSPLRIEIEGNAAKPEITEAQSPLPGFKLAVIRIDGLGRLTYRMTMD